MTAAEEQQGQQQQQGAAGAVAAVQCITLQYMSFTARALVTASMLPESAYSGLPSILSSSFFEKKAFSVSRGAASAERAAASKAQADRRFC